MTAWRGFIYMNLSDNNSHSIHDRHTETLIKKQVEEFGWFAALFETEGDSPSFVYTIGLWKTFGAAELILFGLPPSVIHKILANIVAEYVETRTMISERHRYPNVLDDVDVSFLKVHPGHYPNYLGYGVWYNGRKSFPVFQVIVPDRNDRFPWEAEFDHSFNVNEPLLDSLPDDS